MQAYGPGFARVYDRKWSGFARNVGPRIREFYEATPVGRTNRAALDLCCGTGALSVYLLEAGYRVVGIDLSEAMLAHARENARRFADAGRARFVHADASDFSVDERFGLVVSTFDALNHLESEEALRGCFRSVLRVCDGAFVFDLNTRAGLRRWNSIEVDESGDDAVIIGRGIYDGRSDRAWTRISGFFRTGDGLYERFEETVFNTVFEMERVRAALLETGWREVHFARLPELGTPILDPEREGRVWVVAQR